MSITVRFWNEKDLEAVENGDDWLLTLLVNKKTFCPDEMKTLLKNLHRVKTYVINFDKDVCGPDVEGVIVKAPNIEMLKAFLAKEYTWGWADLTVHHKVEKYEEIKL